MMVSPVRMRVGAEPTDDSLMRGRVCRLDSPYGGVSPTHDLLLASHAACLQAIAAGLCVWGVWERNQYCCGRRRIESPHDRPASLTVADPVFPLTLLTSVLSPITNLRTASAMQYAVYYTVRVLRID